MLLKKNSEHEQTIYFLIHAVTQLNSAKEKYCIQYYQSIVFSCFID